MFEHANYSMLTELQVKMLRIHPDSPLWCSLRKVTGICKVLELGGHFALSPFQFSVAVSRIHT